MCGQGRGCKKGNGGGGGKEVAVLPWAPSSFPRTTSHAATRGSSGTRTLEGMVTRSFSACVAAMDNAWPARGCGRRCTVELRAVTAPCHTIRSRVALESVWHPQPGPQPGTHRAHTCLSGQRSFRLRSQRGGHDWGCTGCKAHDSVLLRAPRTAAHGPLTDALGLRGLRQQLHVKHATLWPATPHGAIQGAHGQQILGARPP